MPDQQATLSIQRLDRGTLFLQSRGKGPKLWSLTSQENRQFEELIASEDQKTIKEI
jgi:hypothetical protein